MDIGEIEKTFTIEEMPQRREQPVRETEPSEPAREKVPVPVREREEEKVEALASA